MPPNLLFRTGTHKEQYKPNFFNEGIIRRVRRGGCTGCTCTPPPHLGKSSAQKCRKEERNFRPDMSAKRNVHVPLRYHKIKTKKLGKKEENSKKKGL